VVVCGHSNNPCGITQDDNVSCGIYVCVLCKCIAEGSMPTPELMNKHTISVQHRYMIANEIIAAHDKQVK
jgi:hypothetical protein